MSSSPQCIVQLVHQGSSVFFYTKIVTARPAFYRSAGLPRSRALLRRQFETTEPASLSAVNRLQRYQVPPTKISALHRTAPFQNDPSCESSLKTQDPSICPRSDAASRRAYAADASSSAAESEGPPATSPDWTPGAGEEGMAAWARAERERESGSPAERARAARHVHACCLLHGRGAQMLLHLHVRAQSPPHVRYVQYNSGGERQAARQHLACRCSPLLVPTSLLHDIDTGRAGLRCHSHRHRQVPRPRGGGGVLRTPGPRPKRAKDHIHSTVAQHGFHLVSRSPDADRTARERRFLALPAGAGDAFPACCLGQAGAAASR